MIESDPSSAGLVVVLKEANPPPLLAERFPAKAERAEYWAVHDPDAITPEETLPEIVRRVVCLVTGWHAAPSR